LIQECADLRTHTKNIYWPET